MYYVSTRGEAPRLGFPDVLLAGLASDGGLYVPEKWPHFDQATIAGFAGRPYAEVAAAVIGPFVGDAIPPERLRAMCEDAYGRFGHPAVAPLVQIGPAEWLLELFHGPTLAFKDVAMQLLARLIDDALAARGRRATIVGATSGDTGGSAIEAFRGRDSCDIFILFPDGRVSDVQRRQMTTLTDRNVHAIAIKGTFDDCQTIVKGLFGHRAFAERVSLAGVNSINWARIVAQIVYYFTSAVALGAPRRPVSFTVPTGNFGDIFAGYVAKRMGLPVEKLVIATNTNDILARALQGGRYELREVVATQSPSMDIQISSNFERLLYFAHGKDAAAVRGLMGGLAQSGSFAIDKAALAEIRSEFVADTASEKDTAATIAGLLTEAGYLLDPHSAVGVAAARRHAVADIPMITLATAHPAKFPDAVEAASGRRPELPGRLAGIMKRKERFTVLPNDKSEVERHILAHGRAVGAEASR